MDRLRRSPGRQAWPITAVLSAAAVIACAKEAPPPATAPPPPADAVPWPAMEFRGQVVALPAGDWHEERAVAVAASSDRFVAVGEALGQGTTRAEVWSSTDGLTWERTRQPQIFEGVSLIDVAAGPVGFVAFGTSLGDPWLGQETRIDLFRSADGLRWERIGDVPDVPGGFATAIGGGPRGFVAVGYTDPEPGAIILVSSDGLTWELVDEETAGDGARGVGEPSRLGDGWLGVSTGPGSMAILRSDDGATWTAHEVEGDGTDGIIVSRVLAGPHGMIATGQAGSCGVLGLGSCPSSLVLWASADGREWARTPGQPGVSWSGALASDPVHGFLALGSEAWASPDGWTWTSLGPMGDGLSGTTDAVVVGDRIVGVGERSAPDATTRAAFVVGAPEGDLPE